MYRSKIEWVLNPDNKTLGWILNPLSGCLNHTPEGLCLGGMFPCYAFRLANGRLKPGYLANANISLEGEYTKEHPEFLSRLKDPFYPRFWGERLRELEDRHTHNNRFPSPIGVFVCDMSDLFGIGVPEEWTRWVLNVIRSQIIYPAQKDRFYLLTKQPQNLIKFSPFPGNCWVGVTCTSKRMVNHSLPFLMKIGAGKLFLSIEPLLDWDDGSMRITGDNLLDAGIDWLIIGAMTGNLEDIKKMLMEYPQLTLMPYGKRWTLQPKIEWVEEIVKAADKAGIPVFLKDNLKPLLINKKGFANVSVGTMIEREIEKSDYKLKQEMPKEG